MPNEVIELIKLHGELFVITKHQSELCFMNKDELRAYFEKLNSFRSQVTHAISALTLEGATPDERFNIDYVTNTLHERTNLRKNFISAGNHKSLTDKDFFDYAEIHEIDDVKVMLYYYLLEKPKNPRTVFSWLY